MNVIIKLGRGQKKETIDSASGVLWKGNAFITAGNFRIRVDFLSSSLSQKSGLDYILRGHVCDLLLLFCVDRGWVNGKTESKMI